MKKEQQNNSTSNALVTTTPTQGILDNGQKELLAGGKVRSKAGGPEMVLVGFTTQQGYFSKDELGSLLTSKQLGSLAVKVIMNEQGEYGYYSTFHTQEFYVNTEFNAYCKSNPYDGLRQKDYHNEWHNDYRKALNEESAGIINPLVLAKYYVYKYRYSSKPFYCLCKYWSNKDEEFKHILLLPSEIEFI